MTKHRVSDERLEKTIAAAERKLNTHLNIGSDMLELCLDLRDARAGSALLREALEAFIASVEAAEAHHQWVRDGSKGQHAPFHGDFASAHPGTMKRLLWWCREFRAALSSSSSGAAPREKGGIG